MKYCIASDYESLSRQVCDSMLDTIKRDPEAVIVLPTGHSPLGAYRLFVKRVKEEKVAVGGITFIQLDEWVGLGVDSPFSCRTFIQKEILDPLSISPSHFIEFRGETANLQEECERVSQQINALKKISLVILGVGKNGHIGLNEPNEVWHMSVHAVELSKMSMTHSMLKQKKQKPTCGLTLGIDSFFQAEEVLLIAAGTDKKEAMQLFFKDIVTPHCPVSILKLHENAVCVIEEELYDGAMEKIHGR